MMYADSITKSFLNAGSSTKGSVTSQFDDYQDPTYLGFQIKLDYSINVGNDMDDLPHGIFTLNPLKDPYSCYNYLMNRGETKRAEYILLFEKGFRELVEKYPWYFVKVSGLADSWKIDTKNNFRGKEKKIVIETLESIDMRVTYLMDLYRKAVFDSAYMRWAVPDHMRYFRMKIIVSEIRPMKLGSAGFENSVFPGYTVGTNTNFKPTVSEMQTNQSGKPGLWDTTGVWSSGSFIEFSYSECELDVFNEAPAFLESVGNAPEAPAANKITIHTHAIHERNIYGLLGAIVNDTPNYQDYDSLTDHNGGGAYFPAFPDSNPVPPQYATQAAGPSVTQYIDGYNDRKSAQTNLAVRGLIYDLVNPTDSVNEVQNNFDRNHEVDTISATQINDADGSTSSSPEFVQNNWNDKRKPEDSKAAEINDADGSTSSSPEFVQNNWNDKRKPSDTTSAEISESAAPGNKSTENAARDFDRDHKGSLRSTGPSSALGSFGNRLAAGAVAAVTDIARSAVNKALLGNVYGVSPLSLIGSAQSILNNPAAAIEAILRKHSSPAIGKELATKVQLTGQEIQLVKSIIGASTTGAEDTVKVNPDLVKNQGKTNLSSATTKTKNPGKTNLDSANINSNDPGKVNLRAPRKAVAKNANSNLTAFAKAGSDPGKVELDGPSSLPASAQKENLEGPEITPAKLGNAQLTGAPVEKGKLGKTNFK